MNRTAVVYIASKEFEKQFEVSRQSVQKHLPECEIIRFYPEEFKSNYWSIVQHICSSRPKAVLEAFFRGFDRVIFLGADVVFYDEPGALYGDYNVIVTPHITEPLPDDSKYPSNEGISRTGHFNSDLVVWKNTSEVTHFLTWMSKILETKCIETNEIFLDQTWLNFVHVFVDKVKILRNPRYNLCYWNIHQREKYLDEKVCIQFSGFEEDQPERMSRHQNRYIAEGKILELYKDYEGKIK